MASSVNKKIILKKLDDSFKSVAVEGLAKAKDLTPVDTGEMQRSWSLHKILGGYIIGNSAPYAEVVNNGTATRAGHHIVERVAQYLAARGGR